MRSIILLLLFVYSSLAAQDMKIVKTTKQTINSGASPTSTTNYSIYIKRSKQCKVMIDSVVNVYTQKTTTFEFYMVADAQGNLNTIKRYDSRAIVDKGIFRLDFYSMKKRGSGRPGAPPTELMVPIADFTQGAIVYYRVGKKKKQLLVEVFEELETINAP